MACAARSKCVDIGIGAPNAGINAICYLNAAPSGNVVTIPHKGWDWYARDRETPSPTGSPTPVELTNSGLTVTSSDEYQGGRWPATNVLLPGKKCPQWSNPKSVAIAGTSYGGHGQQWIQVDLGTVGAVATVHYYYKAILSGSYAGDIATVAVCNVADATSCTSCDKDGGDIDGDFYNCKSTQGRYVRITRTPNIGNNWHFCRMKVYGQTVHAR